MRRTTILIAVLLLVSATFARAQTLNCGDLLQQALAREHMERNLKGAIEVYDRILTQCSQDREVAARAAVQRSQVQARLTFEQILRDYADQPAIVAQARKLLDALPEPPAIPRIFVAQFDPHAVAVRGPATHLTENWDTAEQFPSWSPDGKSIAFRRSAGNAADAPTSIIVRSLASRTERAFEPEAWLTWFPDGNGFLSTRTVVPANGQGETRVEMFRVDLDDRQHKLASVPFLGSNSSLSPDGNTLYSSVLSGDASLVAATVVAFDLATGRTKQIFSMPIDVGVALTTVNPPSRYFAISPDGRTLASARRPMEADAHLALVGTSGDNYRELVTNAGHLLSVTWTPDGRTVLFARLKADNTDTWQIMGIPAVGGTPALTGLEVTNLRLFTLSPDGSRIVFDGTDFHIAGQAK